MVRQHRWFLAFLAAGLAAFAITGAHLGIASARHSTAVSSSDDQVQTTVPMSVTVATKFAAFRRPTPADSATAAERAHLVHEFADGPADDPVAHADFSLAQPVPVAGGAMTAWIAPSGEQVCAFIPDPAGGDGAGCSTMEQINGGLGVTMMGGAELGDSVVVVVLVPDGAAPPTLVSASGQASAISVATNAAAVLAPASTTLRTTGVNWALKRFAHGPQPRPASAG